jgi:hypothetical protein
MDAFLFHFVNLPMFIHSTLLPEFAHVKINRLADGENWTVRIDVLVPYDPQLIVCRTIATLLYYVRRLFLG